MDQEDRYTRITLRIPKELHEHLAASADKTSKSMNAEIIARLEESYLYGDKSPAEKFVEQTVTQKTIKALNDAVAMLTEQVEEMRRLKASQDR